MLSANYMIIDMFVLLFFLQIRALFKKEHSRNTWKVYKDFIYK